ncbi:hypothetical protein [Ferruginibacter sp. HRS2-29]|nr:hypothetical protein [Ferruginibacter sp. HRS2-29]
MVRQKKMDEPSMLNSVRTGVTVALWGILILLLYMNHAWLIKGFNYIINN